MWQIRKPKDETSPEEVAERTEQERRLMTVGDAGAFAPNELHTDLKVELHQRLLGLINLSALEKMSRAQIEEEVGDIVLEELDKQRHALNHAERVLRRPIAFTIANDHDTMNQAIDRGVPISEVRRKCALARDIDAMEQGLVAALGLEH